MTKPRIITIAGLDPTGGAGISADIRAAGAMGVPCGVAVTAVALQTHRTGISVEPTPEYVFRKSLEFCFAEPFGGVKIGMLGNRRIAEVVFEILDGGNIPIVLDTIIASSSGMRLIDDAGLEFMREKLFPISSLLTPNIPECEKLTGKQITTTSEAIGAGRELFERTGTPVLLKGGHLLGNATDYLIDGSGVAEFSGVRVDKDFRGTGCALSTLITAGLALGMPLKSAIHSAKLHLAKSMAESTPPYLIFGTDNA
ncbi:MAG TPA: hydroxymethylpyrimidine/phosphomethylpyrimidine kinase [candidate division Zixibacteria bacterium]|nr:hydroxymethylpyrimidine/phosphomethylpyrimidine kinase [candidate division Zixibacteria bacterium]